MAEEMTDLLIAGGGPAGMMAGLLFARAGVETVVLEKHADFLRDFRGDTVHPATLRIFSELGLLERFLQRPHQKVRSAGGVIGGRRRELVDFSGFDPRWNFIAMMPQWEFLDFLAEEARVYPNFKLLMGAEATGLVMAGSRITGAVYRRRNEAFTVVSKLTVAADGRASLLRERSDLPVRNLGAPIDVFWFRIPKQPAAENETTGVFGAKRIIAMIDRGDYWQCAYIFPKGQADAVRARGLDIFREEIAGLAPRLAEGASSIRGWDDVRLLTVELDRLDRWHRPGLLVIGDAAHAMSPLGGVGINLAIQDAVAAANILAGPMARGEDIDALLAGVQARRLLPVRITQRIQYEGQKRIIARLLAAGTAPARPPLFVVLLSRFRLLRRLPALIMGFGFRPEHVRSPVARTSVPRRGSR